jgi:hypothetical protein
MARGAATVGLALALLALPLVLSCGDRERAPATFPLPSNLPEPTTPLEVRLRERGPIDAPTLVPFAAPYSATYAEGESRTFNAVLRGGGICYKVLGQGGDGVTDVDLLIYDPDNVLQQRDDDVGAEPVVGSHRPMCPSEPGLWRIEVVARAGAGEIAAQVWVAP